MPNPKDEARKRLFSCAWCGAECWRRPFPNMHPTCSTACRTAWTIYARGLASSQWPRMRPCRRCRQPFHVTQFNERRCPNCQGRDKAWRPAPKDVVECQCPVCGKQRAETARRGRHDTFCSPDCRVAARLGYSRFHREKRRALMMDAYVAPVDRAEVYARDKYRCHICGDRVDMALTFPDPMSHSLDHVVPLSRGGTHEPANASLAHLGCNVRKGNRGGGEQLALIG